MLRNRIRPGEIPVQAFTQSKEPRPLNSLAPQPARRDKHGPDTSIRKIMRTHCTQIPRQSAAFYA